MKFDGFGIVMWCLCIAAIGCAIAGNFSEPDLEIYFDMLGILFALLATLLFTCWSHGEHERKMIERDLYIEELMERVNDLEKAKKSENP